METHKDQVLQRLALVKDEPADKLIFGFKKFVDQIVNVLQDEKTPTPYVIGIHGEWGSGKTSLIKGIKKTLDEKIKDTDWTTMEFNAWEYERVDVVTALLRHIQIKYEETGKKAQDFASSIGSFVLDAALRKIVGLSKKEAEFHFEQFVDTIPTIKNNLEKITKDSRLVVFVDDLDRCNIDNVLDMLEAIKMFLTAKGVIFIVAVDMKKIERAWQLRYNKEEGLAEGRDHIDKIFQLKLSLPPKTPNEIKKLVDSIVPENTLADVEKNLIIHGCPPNPRKIKRVLNLVYFILKGLPDDEDFDKKVPLVIIWCILVTSFPELAKIIKKDVNSLITMSFLCNDSHEFSVFSNHWAEIREHRVNGRFIDFGNGSILPARSISEIGMKGLEYVFENENAFNLFKVFGMHYEIIYNSKKSSSEIILELEKKITPTLNEIINEGGMTGI